MGAGLLDHVEPLFFGEIVTTWPVVSEKEQHVIYEWHTLEAPGYVAGAARADSSLRHAGNRPHYSIASHSVSDGFLRWQQRGSNRRQYLTERTRKPGPHRPGFLLTQSTRRHAIGLVRTTQAGLEVRCSIQLSYGRRLRRWAESG